MGVGSLNKIFHKVFMLACIIMMGMMMFIIFSSTGSNVFPDETGGAKFNPLFLLLLLCPLLHLLMMRSHGGNCHNQGKDKAECSDRKESK
jgi:cytochrome c biogenesis factor